MCEKGMKQPDPGLSSEDRLTVGALARHYSFLKSVQY
jgi:hypothetical protein